MPIATPEVYNEMLDTAKKNGFAFPAINCTSSETINAALKGFAEAESDGIIQFSTGGAAFGSGLALKDKVKGAQALAAFAHEAAKHYGVNIALHTDHCQKEVLDEYVRPLLAISQERVDRGENPLFQSHMWDGSAIPIDENLVIAQELLEKAKNAHVILMNLGYDLDSPWQDLPKEDRDWILFTEERPVVTVKPLRGKDQIQRNYEGTWRSVASYLNKTLAETQSDTLRKRTLSYMESRECETCGGRRLNPAALKVTYAGMPIDELGALPLDRVR